jgi:hypothetical protein
MAQIKSILHLYCEMPDDGVRQLVDSQKRAGTVAVKEFHLQTDNAREALQKIFAADAVCVWSATATVSSAS